MNDYYTPFTKKNIFLEFVLVSAIIGNSMLHKWHTTKKAKEELENARIKMEDAITSTRSFYSEFKSEAP